MNKFITLVVLFATLLLAIFLLADTGLFAYSFLSNVYCLHLYVIGILALLFFILLFNDKSKAGHLSIPFLVFCLWGLYITLNSTFRTHAESYFTSYLTIFFFISFSLFFFCKHQLIDSQLLLIPIAFAGLIEGIVVILQYLRILSSHSTFFTVTGTTDNPNIAAMFIALSIPACVTTTKMLKCGYRYVVIIMWIILITSLFVLQCRSALIGAGVIALVYMIVEWRGSILKITGVYKALILTGIIISILFTVYLYQQKRASAYGRLTIWKISGEMIAQRPLSGYGYGFFQREYNLQQADYFNRESRSEEERKNARFTAMAYNEYIEQTIMGGLPGGLLFISTLIILLWSGWQRKEENVAPLASIAAFAVMSIVNYTIQSPLLFFAFIIYATLLLAQKSSSVSTKTYIIPRKLAIAFCLTGIILTFSNLQKYNAQKQLKIARDLMQKGVFGQAESIVGLIEKSISTSELFYRTKSELLARRHLYKEANLAMDQALQYTSTTNQLLTSAQLLEKLGDFSTAEHQYRLVCGIEPHQFRPRVLLMEMYLRRHQIEKARYMAYEIIRMKPKFNSEKVLQYKQYALKVINSYKNESNHLTPIG